MDCEKEVSYFDEWILRMIHVVGNSVLDIPLRYVPSLSSDTADGWTENNVHFLDQAVDGVLGGCGAATAYVLGKLGHLVSLNTQVGTDTFGGVVRLWLEQAGVEIIGSSAQHTAVNVIPLSEDGARRSLYYTGLKIDWKKSQDVSCDTFFASGYGQVDGADIVALTEIFQHMQARGIPVVFDPGPWFMMQANEADMVAAWACVDVLVGTQDELNTWMQKKDVFDLAVSIRELGAKCVVIKQGAAGASFCDGDGACDQVATTRVEQAYTVGAGDTFNAGLLHGLSQGQSVREAVEFAVYIATRVVKNNRGALGAFDL